MAYNNLHNAAWDKLWLNDYLPDNAVDCIILNYFHDMSELYPH